MNNPTCIKEGLTYDQALETIDYLFGMFCEIETTPEKVRAIYKGELVVNYNKHFGCLMVSKDFIELRKQLLKDYIRR